MKRMSIGRAWRLAIVAVLISVAAGAAIADDYWQLQADRLTVVAAGKKATAAQAATAIVRLQETVRWMAGWPMEYRPPPALALVLSNGTIERYFGKAGLSGEDSLGPDSAQGLAIAIPQTSVVIFSMSPVRGREFERLKLLYGRGLLGPNARWPECVRFGISIVAASSEARKGNELYIPGGRVRFPVDFDFNPYAPRDFIAPVDLEEPTEITRDRRGYSCYTLASMAVHEQPLPRAAYTRYFDLVSEGAEFEQAAQSAFGISDAEFTGHLRAYAHQLRFDRDRHDLRIEVPWVTPDWPEPEPLGAERMHGILSQLSTKVTPATPQ